MRNLALMTVGALWITGFAMAAGPIRGAEPPATKSQVTVAAETSAVISTYCSGCHNGTMRSPSGALLDSLDVRAITTQPEVWARAYRQLQAGTMPPVGAPRPDAAAYNTVLHTIDSAWAVTPPSAPADSTAVAVRLAALLWNSAPDSILLEEAKQNRLRDREALEAQVRRMLADDRAEAFVSRFFFPWLNLDKLSTFDPEEEFFPGYDVTLREAFEKETQLFLRSQLREDHDPIDLWNADYTFINEQLARHYGIPNITGTGFRRVTSSPERAGLLGQGSILMITSRTYGGYTTPAGRSTWLRTRFLGAPPPRAFPNAPPVKRELPITPQTRTLPLQPCRTCHDNFFPLGYALENFDPLGRWRTRDQAGPVDASGTFVDGSPTNGVIQLRQVLLQRPEAFRTTITEELLLFASGKDLNPNNRTPETLQRAREILGNLPHVRWSALIAEVVR